MPSMTSLLRRRCNPIPSRLLAIHHAVNRPSFIAAGQICSYHAATMQFQSEKAVGKCWRMSSGFAGSSGGGLVLSNTSPHRASNTFTPLHQHPWLVCPEEGHRSNRISNNISTLSSTMQQSRWFSRPSRGGTGKGPDMSNCRSIEELVQMAHNHLKDMAPRDLSAFWTLASKHLLNAENNNSQMKEEVGDQLDLILGHTLEKAGSFGYRDLSQTTLGMAKIVKMMDSRGGTVVPLEEGSTHQILHNLFIGEKNSENKQLIFDELATASISILHRCDPRHLSNLIYAFGLAKHELKFEHGRTLFDVLALVAIPKLEGFNEQDLSIMLWAYANADASNANLFREAGDSIVARDSLGDFKPQAFANIVWAYATLDEEHPMLLRKVADHIVSIDNLDSFKFQELSDIVWAYATAKESSHGLFEKVSYAAIQRQDDFDPQVFANFLWAYATNGQTDQKMFQSMESVAASLLCEFSSQGLSNIAWAYAVADVAAPSLFTQDFVNACMKKEDDFTLEALRQLYQWQLWQEEMKTNIRLPPSLHEKCHDAFISQEPTPSALQDDVIAELKSIGLHPEEEVLTERGFRLDAIVEVNGNKVGIEVDGPTHLLGRKPTGSTILKHRQVTNLDEIPVVSVPYWEWDDELRKDSDKKQQYLRSLLGI